MWRRDSDADTCGRVNTATRQPLGPTCVATSKRMAKDESFFWKSAQKPTHLWCNCTKQKPAPEGYLLGFLFLRLWKFGRKSCMVLVHTIFVHTFRKPSRKRTSMAIYTKPFSPLSPQPTETPCSANTSAPLTLPGLGHFLQLLFNISYFRLLWSYRRIIHMQRITQVHGATRVFDQLSSKNSDLGMLFASFTRSFSIAPVRPGFGSLLVFGLTTLNHRPRPRERSSLLSSSSLPENMSSSISWILGEAQRARPFSAAQQSLCQDTNLSVPCPGAVLVVQVALPPHPPPAVEEVPLVFSSFLVVAFSKQAPRQVDHWWVPMVGRGRRRVQHFSQSVEFWSQCVAQQIKRLQRRKLGRAECWTRRSRSRSRPPLPCGGYGGVPGDESRKQTPAPGGRP